MSQQLTTPAPSPDPAPDDSPLSDALSAAPFNPRRGAHWLVHVGSPLGISLAIHAALLAILAGVTWAVAVRGGEEWSQEYEATIIAEGPTEGPTGGFHFPGPAAVDRPDSAEKGAFDLHSAAGLAELLRHEDKLEIPRPSGLGALTQGAADDSPSRLDLIGVGRGGGALSAAGPGGGFGDRDVAGGGPIGSLWGVGSGQRARSIVYVVDRSGSFVDWMEVIDLELKRSIGVLQQDQAFNVIFLRDNAPLAFQPRLIAADESGKRRAFTWINQNPPSGGSNLTPAARAAIRFAPDILFIVTDYALLSSPVESTNVKELLQTVRTARRARPMTINVILMGPFERPAGTAADLRRRLDSGGGGSPQQEAVLREQLDVLDTIEAVQKMPAETGGTLQYLNGDALMAEWKKSRGVP